MTPGSAKRSAAKGFPHLLAASIVVAMTIALLWWVSSCDFLGEEDAFRQATQVAREDVRSAQRLLSQRLVEAGSDGDLEVLAAEFPFGVVHRRVDASRRSVELDLVVVQSGPKLWGEVQVALCVRVSGQAGMSETKAADMACPAECVRLTSQIPPSPLPTPAQQASPCPDPARATVDRIVKLS